ncbi:MAG: hypothetical protein HYZ57_02850 [Acidobacteria bacterium]|nr:hypothetical protein [Acidobacteriota bacterium]
MNQALRFLQQALPPAEAARRLARAHGISDRQAHRYVQLAGKNAAPVSVPEEKAVFTVKLPRSLIRRVRRTARQRGGEISAWVAAALQQALPADSSHG